MNSMDIRSKPPAVTNTSVVISKRVVQKSLRKRPFKRHVKWPQASIDYEHEKRRKLMDIQRDQRMVCSYISINQFRILINQSHF